MRIRLAQLTSNILNPFLVSLVVLILLSFKSASGTFDALRWASISIALSILPVFAVIVYLVHNKKLEGIFVSPRRQRNNVYLLATVCAVVGCILLSYLGAPRVLMAAFVAGLSAIIVFMGINHWWKISVHTAFVGASVTVLIIIFGSIAAVTAVLFPLIAWARVEMEQHSPAQVATGAFLAVLIVVVVFYLFGLVGPVTPV